MTNLLLFSCSGGPSEGREPQLERRVASLLELHTVEYRYRDIVYFGEQEYLLGIFRTRDQQILFAVDIRVEAGIDLSRGVEVLRDPSDSQLLLVRLPAPEVLMVDADEGSIEQFFVRERGGSIEWNQVSGEMESVKARVKEDAIATGILTRAEENARELVEELLKLTGFSRVEVQIRNPEALRG